MKTKSLLTFIVAAAMIVHTNVIFAQKADKTFDGWTLLGTREVDYTIDRDVISLKESKHNITGLKFVVKTGTLNMHKATVHFANGDTQDIEFPEGVRENNDGRLWDLKGNSRKIEKVTFWYDTKNNSKDKSVIEVWGK
jgi:Protein of unknown function (DUF2541)